MPATLPRDHPNLLAAASRLRRNLWVWAGLFLAMAALIYAADGQAHILRTAPWIAGAVLLAFSRQPVLLAMVSIFWGLELIHLVPGAEAALGPNPLAASLGSGPLESLGYAVLEAVMMITAWNQFMFFRMLYGSEGFSGLDPDSPPIPEVIPNRTSTLAWASLALGLGAAVASATVVAAAGRRDSAWAIEATLGLAEMAIGLGLGVSFSPTTRRRLALAGTLMGAAGFALGLAIHQAIGGGGT